MGRGLRSSAAAQAPKKYLDLGSGTQGCAAKPIVYFPSSFRPDRSGCINTQAVSLPREARISGGGYSASDTGELSFEG